MDHDAWHDDTAEDRQSRVAPMDATWRAREEVESEWLGAHLAELQGLDGLAQWLRAAPAKPLADVGS
jgi:hypothetical protein